MHNGFAVTDSMRNYALYTGKSNKFGITVDDEKFLVKLPEKKGKKFSPFTEYIASGFICAMGLNCQQVWLGSYRGHPVSIIKDFTDLGELISYDGVHQSCLDTDLADREYTYDDILYVLSRRKEMTQEEYNKIAEQFWTMYICDAILGNRDRHGENWGYLRTSTGCKPASFFDNGASLFPDVGEHLDEFKANEFQFLRERSERFPTSLFKAKRGDGSVRRTNYYEVLGYADRYEQFGEVRKLFRFEDVYSSIKRVTDSVGDLLGEDYRNFYIMIVCMRYLHNVERLSFEDSYKLIMRRMEL